MLPVIDKILYKQYQCSRDHISNIPSTRHKLRHQELYLVSIFVNAFYYLFFLEVWNYIYDISFVDFYNPTAMVPRASAMPNPLPATANPSQPSVQISMVPNNTQPQNFTKPTTNKRRANALKIIDPSTGRF